MLRVVFPMPFQCMSSLRRASYQISPTQCRDGAHNGFLIDLRSQEFTPVYAHFNLHFERFYRITHIICPYNIHGSIVDAVVTSGSEYNVFCYIIPCLDRASEWFYRDPALEQDIPTTSGISLQLLKVCVCQGDSVCVCVWCYFTDVPPQTQCMNRVPRWSNSP